MRESKTPYWEIPYLPIDPADVGREYEPIIRINSQSGKGGAAFIMDHNYGYHMPKAMHPEFGAVVQAECDRTGRELTANEVYELFHREFLNISEPYALSRAKFYEEAIAGSAANVTHFSGVLSVRGQFVPAETARSMHSSTRWGRRASRAIPSSPIPSTPFRWVPIRRPWPTSSCVCRAAAASSASARSITSTLLPSRAF